MLKKLLRYYSFNLLTCCLLLATCYSLFGCAPKAVAPPPLYRDTDLSLDEVITIARGDINTLKAITSINIEKDDKPYSYIDASILLKKPDWLHMRLYRFGIMVGNFLIKDNVVYAMSGKGSSKFREFSKELYYSVFWWEDLDNALMHKQDAEYIIKTKNKEIHLDKATLLPESQEIIADNKRIYIVYDKPKKEADFWYPSEIKIGIGTFRFTVKVEKLFVTPVLEENDFKEPGIE